MTFGFGNNGGSHLFSNLIFSYGGIEIPLLTPIGNFPPPAVTTIPSSFTFDSIIGDSYDITNPPYASFSGSLLNNQNLLGIELATITNSNTPMIGNLQFQLVYRVTGTFFPNLFLDFGVSFNLFFIFLIFIFYSNFFILK